MLFQSAPDAFALLCQANPVAAMFGVAIVSAAFAAWLVKAVF